MNDEESRRKNFGATQKQKYALLVLKYDRDWKKNGLNKMCAKSADIPC